MSKGCVLVLDHGTSGLKACVLDAEGRIVSRVYSPFSSIYPQPGWVEHDPLVLWRLTLPAAQQALREAGLGWQDVAGIGITNQRETTVLWDKTTGQPVYNAIVWQCRRTADYCADLKRQGLEGVIRSKTGLLADPYFSATKVRWILREVPNAARLLSKGKLLFGTVDSWILWNLSGGRLHATDPTNASRTLLYNIHTKDWDDELLRLFDIPEEILPEVRLSGAMVGETAPSLTGGVSVPLAAVLGDQQAALYGQRCWRAGTAKSTYGTGTFAVMNLGEEDVVSQAGLLTTIAADGEGKPSYALEGAIFVSGGALTWLQEGLGLISSPEEADLLAASLPDNEGVYFVPAFVGLGAPYWEAEARGLICGLTQGCGPAHLARASFEAMAFQTKEVVDAMERDAGLNLSELRVDGGVSKSEFFTQFLADVLQRSILRLDSPDITAKGVGYLAGLAAGVWSSPRELAALPEEACRVEPEMSPNRQKALCDGWREAIRRCRQAG